MQREFNSKDTFGLVSRSLSREILKVLAAGDDAYETSL